ncbi:BnaC08g47840D [Brassica napus]|uniref:BnaC08g47840D protein n=1 Tax=Brassica napus TaxID=3708 RepID=A0A078IT33_BRANA|nr:BnaC08g47840D [Brassica napus]
MSNIFFGKETHAGEVCFYELISKYSGNNPAPSLLRGYAKVEPLSISELNQFVITCKPQEIEFVCTGKVIGIRWKFQRRVRNKKEIYRFRHMCPTIGGTTTSMSF